MPVPDRINFKVAEGAEVAQALQLRSDLYRQELGHSGIDAYDDCAHQLIACCGDEIIAALRIVLPDHRPFDIEHVISLSDSLPCGRVPAEISRFCIRRDRRRVQKGFLIHVGMLRLAIAFARSRGVSDFVTLALPHLLNLYRVAFFRPMASSQRHPIWGPVRPMRLDLLELEARSVASDQRLRRLLGATDLAVSPKRHL
jgi:predicted GNAT family N-acyltransferase